MFFFELAHSVGPGSHPPAGPGGQRYFRFANYYLKCDRHHTDRHLGPFLDHFGADTIRIS